MELTALLLGFTVMLLLACVWIDRHIHTLIDEAFAERCTLCQFRAYRNGLDKSE